MQDEPDLELLVVQSTRVGGHVVEVLLLARHHLVLWFRHGPLGVHDEAGLTERHTRADM